MKLHQIIYALKFPWEKADTHITQEEQLKIISTFTLSQNKIWHE